MRVGEALNLDLMDVDLDQGILTIRNAKFGKSRLVPVHATTCTALKLYLEQRQAFLAGRDATPFCVTPLGRRVTHRTLDDSFRRLCRKLGLRGDAGVAGPRLHAMRHSMAVKVLPERRRVKTPPRRL
jgi:integrase